MEIINRTMTITIDMKDAEMLLSWYKSEQEKLLKGQVSEEFRDQNDANSIYEKMLENYHLIYQISKLPRWGELVPISNIEVIPELEKHYFFKK